MISYPRLTALKLLHNERDGLVTKRALGRRIKKLVETSKSRFYALFIYLGRDSSVGIATRYGLDGPGIE